MTSARSEGRLWWGSSRITRRRCARLLLHAALPVVLRLLPLMLSLQLLLLLLLLTLVASLCVWYRRAVAS